MRSLITSKKGAIGFFCLVFLAAIPGLVQVGIEKDASHSLQSIYGEGIEALKIQRENYPSDFGDKIYVLIPEKEEDVEQWSRNLRSLHQDLEQVAYRVESLINARHTHKQVFDDGEVGINVDDLVSPGEELTPDLLAKAKQYNLYREILVDRFSDGSYWAVINVIAQGPLEEGEDLYSFDAVVFNDQVSAVVEKYRHHFAGLYRASEPRMSAEISRMILASTKYLGISVVLMLLLTWLHVQYFWKGLIVGFLAAFNGAAGLLIAWAAMGYAGVDRTPITDIMSQMLLPLGAANVIHVHGYCKQFGRVSYAFFFRAVAMSFVIAMATTAVGFGATGISIYPAMQQFGGFGVIGIFGCLLTTLFLVFPLMAEMEFDDRPSGIVKILKPIFGKVVKGPVILSPPQLLATMAAILVTITGGFWLLETDYKPIEYLWPSNPVRMELETVLEESPIYTSDVVVVGEPPELGYEYGSVFEPAVLKQVHELGQELERNFPGLRAVSIWEVLQRIWLDSGMTEAEFPKSKEGVTQELFVSFADQYDQELYFTTGVHYEKYDATTGEITVVRKPSTVRLMLHLPYKGSAEHRKLVQAVDDFQAKIGDVTGRMDSYLKAGDGIVWDSDLSSGISFLVLTLMFACLLRSVRLTVAAMLANVLPIALGIAALGLLSIKRGISTSITAPIGLCIVVDDTTHFLMQYRELRRQGLSSNEAAHLTLKRRWEQIFVTSVVIIVGLLPMAFAPLTSFAEFDLLIAIMIGFAVFGDLVLLPSLLVTFEEMRFSFSPTAKVQEKLGSTSSAHQIHH